MPGATATQPPSLTFQGIVVPGSSLNPKAFFAGTRRQTVLQKTLSSFAGFGDTDVVDTLRAGILSGYFVKVSGSLVIANGESGQVNTTSRWPMYLLRSGVFQANGQSNLVNADGWHLRLREIQTTALSDRGVPQTVGSGTVNQGTLSLDSESWGVGCAATGIANGSYDVELTFYVPVAYEKKMLTGAIFCQTLSTTLELDLNWANLSDLFVISGTAAVTFEPSVTVEAEMYTIPSDGKGGMFLPNLSAFHSFVQNKGIGGVSNGPNEFTLAGQGVGRQLMRINYRVLTQVSGEFFPLIPSASTYTQPYWRYGTNTTPETWLDGRDLRYENERNYNSDIGAVAGFQSIDFDEEWGFRDSVDEGSATELRFGFQVPSGVTLSNPLAEYTQDTILAGAAA